MLETLLLLSNLWPGHLLSKPPRSVRLLVSSFPTFLSAPQRLAPPRNVVTAFSSTPAHPAYRTGFSSCTPDLSSTISPGWVDSFTTDGVAWLELSFFISHFLLLQNFASSATYS
ncbi:hypothetical protein IWX49DRAFT_575623 [Phyllosticta citricarpa]